MTVIDNYRRRQAMGWPLPPRRSASKDKAALLAEEAIRRIEQEAGCSYSDAKETLDWLRDLTCQARVSGYLTAYPTDADLASRRYEIMDKIMPHDALPRPESAHEAVTTALLSRTSDEYCLVHRQTGDGPQRYCTVELVIDRL